MRTGVTGGNGLLGKTLCSLEEECVPITRRSFDITSEKRIIEYFNGQVYKFNCLIHCAAMIGSKCEENKLMAYRTNVIGTKNVYMSCLNYNIPMIYISTDYVFQGNLGDYNEDGIPFPKTYYALSKYLGEEIVLRNRLNKVFRVSFCQRPWPYEFAYFDKISNRCYVDQVAKIILKLATHYDKYDEQIVHIGTSKKSFYHLALQTKKDVKPNSCDGTNTPKDTSFDLTRMFGILDKIDPEFAGEVRRWE